MKLILVLAATIIFIRIYLNNFDIPHKNIVSTGLGLALVSFLSVIQFIIDVIMNLIF